MNNLALDFKGMIDNCLTDAEFTQLPNFYRGKVRDAYDLPDNRRVMVATDRQSAFDIVLAAVPFKGQVLNETARFWFEQTEDICPNHVISYPDPNIIISRKLDMLPVEMVVRSYMTGSTNTSIWPMYDRGERVLYGHNFPDGLVKNQKLPETILTPTTKAEQGEHDAPITAEEIVEQNLLTAEQWDKLAALSLALFARGQEMVAKNGLILVDTKYEFGLDEHGTITLADEIHTPDSSRYWVASEYEDRFSRGVGQNMLDKENIRQWLLDRGFSGDGIPPELTDEVRISLAEQYIELFELLTDKKFIPQNGQVADRITHNLKKTGYLK